MSYANLDNLLNDYLPDVQSAEDVAAVTRILANVSAMIDRYTGRAKGFFNQAGQTGAAKIIYGNSTSFLELPPFVKDSVSDVTAPGSRSIPTFVEYGDELRRGLQISDSDGVVSFDCDFEVWTNGVPYSIMARWGWADIPLDVEEAARQLTMRFWQVQRGVLGQINPAGYVVERDMPPAVKTLLEPYVLVRGPESKTASTGSFFSTDFNSYF